MLRVHLILFTLARLVTDTGYRMVFPFLPIFAKGLNADVAVLSLLVSFRQTLGIAAPVFGSVADLYGRKLAMVIGLGLIGGSYGIFVLAPSLPTFAIAVLGSAIGKTMIDPAVSAYLGEHVRHERRGTAFAIIEFGWAGGFLIGVPVMGWLISQSSWNTPFLPLALLAFLAAVVFFLVFPKQPVPGQAPSLWRAIHTVVSDSSTLAVLIVGLLICLSNGVVMIVYGVWLDTTFHLSPAILGATTIVIGLAELVGEAVVAAFADRLNFRRSLLLAMALNVIAAASLPLFGGNLLGALGGLFLFSLSFEYIVVCTIPVIVEMVPQARATAMASKSSFQRTGFALGTFLGPLFFQQGIGLVASAAAMAALASSFIMLFLVRPSRHMQPVGLVENELSEN